MNRTVRTFSGPPVLSVERLSAYYGDQLVFSNVTFDVHRGEIFFIAGNSGGGKSTLLRQVIGLHPIAGGGVRILDRNLTSPTTRADADPFPHRLCGVAFQGGALFGSRTVLENVRLPLEEFTELPPSLMDFVALTKLHMVGLGHAARKLPSELSGGMQKRAAIARAIALDPQIVFLDEPSAGLDPLTSVGLDALINELNRNLGMTFVVISHELPSIYAIADRVAVLNSAQKRLVAIDTPQALRDSSSDLWIHSFFNREPIADPQVRGEAK